MEVAQKAISKTGWMGWKSSVIYDKKMKEYHLEECCIGIVDLAETPVFLSGGISRYL